MEHFSEREQMVEVVNKLFIYTDYQKWDKLLNEVFTGNILFDMSSLGQEIKTITAKEVCEIWQRGFEGLDSVNHLTGNYLVTINGETADVFAYGTATHYKNSAIQGKTREFTGSYDLHLTKVLQGWRIDVFKYNLKFMDGNLELK